jgi:hypothetical protein
MRKFTATLTIRFLTIIFLTALFLPQETKAQRLSRDLNADLLINQVDKSGENIK